ncbi:hypothetical protein MW887_004748 [Aspergillus wentii]|nr:hypothetical protein MW887_004748 [Aspergillus wentii]
MLEIWIEFGLLKSKTVSNTFFVLITLCAEEVLHGPGKDRGRATTRAKGTLRDWYVIHNTRINDSRGFSRAGRHPASHDGETSPPSRSGIHRSTPAPVNTPSQPLHDNEIPEPVTNTVNTEFSNEFFSEPFSEPSTAATKAVQSPTKAASPSHRTQTKITTITRTAVSWLLRLTAASARNTEPVVGTSASTTPRAGKRRLPHLVAVNHLANTDMVQRLVSHRFRDCWAKTRLPSEVENPDRNASNPPSNTTPKTNPHDTQSRHHSQNKTRRPSPY